MSTESNDLLEPNYLNSITGGISFAQYEKIKQIEDVDIAAPVAVIGYANIGLTIKDQMTAPKAPGFYRISRTEYSDSGLKKEKLFTTNIHAIKSDVSSELRIPNLDNFFVEDINPSKMAMIVAIDRNKKHASSVSIKASRKVPHPVISKRRTKQIRHLMSLTVLRYRSSSIRILQMRDIPTLKSNGLIYHLKRNNNRRRRSTASNSNQNYRII